jgi:DNA-binding NarL/FixJ family response regulator
MVSWFSTSKEEAVKFAKINAVDILLIDINLEASKKENYDGIFATIEVLEGDIKANEDNPLKRISEEYAWIRKKETLQILTPTEHEGLSLLEQRFRQSQIAEKFCITPDCVKKHVS